MAILEEILELGRWAPSGDNTQPWMFEIIDERHAVIHGSDTRTHCVYDLDGHPSQIAIGALIETIAIGATSHGLDTRVSRRTDMPADTPTFDLYFDQAAGIVPSPLIPSIPLRSVQRRPLSTRDLSSVEKQALETSVGADFKVIWLEGFSARLQAAKVMFRNAKLRLTLPEAFQTHVSVIEWNARYSQDRVPDQALGVDKGTARLMRWIMSSWGRVKFFNTYLGGTLAPRIQMDFLPGIACGAHFVITARQPAKTIDDYVNAGRAVQRFWLTAANLGLQLQPELTPLIFSRYAREGREYSTIPSMNQQGTVIENDLTRLIGEHAALHSVFMGRIGAGKAAQSRSTRKDLSRLMVSKRGSGQAAEQASVLLDVAH